MKFERVNLKKEKIAVKKKRSTFSLSGLGSTSEVLR